MAFVLTLEKALFILAALFVGFALGFVLGEFNGKGIGRDLQQSKQNIAIIQGEQKHEKKLQEVRRLSDDDLIRRYCRWVYDVPFDTCVKNTVLVE